MTLLRPTHPENAYMYEAEIEDMLSGECDPYEYGNFGEALINTDNKSLKTLSALARLGKYEELGKKLCISVCKYWEDAAAALLDDRLNAPATEDYDVPF